VSSVFKKATRKQSKLRLALLGPSGAGKTYTALALAKHLGKRVAVIDSERGSASLYAGDVCDFDVLELENFSPRAYVDAIQAAEREGYDVIVTDSLTHAWSGKGGALEMVDNAAKRTQSRNSYMAWRDVTPEHNALVDAMIGCRAHFIATIRVKTAYELQEDDRGKKAPVKIGMAPIQRDGLEYEFTLVGDLDLQHNLMVSKTRCSVFDGAVINRPGEQMALKLLSWLNSGEVRGRA
jgi:DNA polymerase III delta prime subunit